MYIRYVRNHLSWSKNWGSLNWSETPYFHKGGPLRMEPKLPLSAEKKGKIFFFKQLYLGNYVTEAPKVGLRLKIFAIT